VARFIDDCTSVRDKVFDSLPEERAKIVFPITILEIQTLII